MIVKCKFAQKYIRAAPGKKKKKQDNYQGICQDQT